MYLVILAAFPVLAVGFRRKGLATNVHVVNVIRAIPATSWLPPLKFHASVAVFDEYDLAKRRGRSSAHCTQFHPVEDAPVRREPVSETAMRTGRGVSRLRRHGQPTSSSDRPTQENSGCGVPRCPGPNAGFSLDRSWPALHHLLMLFGLNVRPARPHQKLRDGRGPAGQSGPSGGERRGSGYKCSFAGRPTAAVEPRPDDLGHAHLLVPPERT
jgi:hypothetical protein